MSEFITPSFYCGVEPLKHTGKLRRRRGDEIDWIMHRDSKTGSYSNSTAIFLSQTNLAWWNNLAFSLASASLLNTSCLTRKFCDLICQYSRVLLCQVPSIRFVGMWIIQWTSKATKVELVGVVRLTRYPNKTQIQA
jgi:hypothetical protein